MSSIRTILYPTDFSDCSRYAFRLARILAREQGARLCILHVKPTLGPMLAYGDALAALEPEDSSEKLLEILHRLQVSDPKVQMEHRLVDGEGAQEILRQAAEIGADLIVMGTHGRTGLDHLLMGSVAGEVLRNAQCPVVTVKIPARISHAIQSPATEPSETRVSTVSM
jgi:nucleotide-binding universal stress UspA family protein